MFDLLFGWRKASKCKKLIKRVQCRIKILKNKKQAIVKQLREDVAELIRIGFAESGFKRAEEIINDESIIAVYELLDTFCEFIILNLSYIRRNKDCPNDINEAISSLIFASARCGDLPELIAIRKLFGARYGLRFATSAVELSPGNLVNNQIKEKLLMKSVPDDVKHRLMNEIARDHCFQPEILALEFASELQKMETNDESYYNEIQETQLQVLDAKEIESKNVDSAGNNILSITCHSHQDSDILDNSISSTLVREISPDLSVSLMHNTEENVETFTSLHSLDQLVKEERISPTSPLQGLVQFHDELAISHREIEEFESSMERDRDSLDQRAFKFKQLVLPKENFEDGHEPWSKKVGTEIVRKRTEESKKRSRRRSLSRESQGMIDIGCLIYYSEPRKKALKKKSTAEESEGLEYANERLQHPNSIEVGSKFQAFKCKYDRTRSNCRKYFDGEMDNCSLKQPCYCCTGDDKNDREFSPCKKMRGIPNLVGIPPPDLGQVTFTNVLVPYQFYGNDASKNQNPRRKGGDNSVTMYALIANPNPLHGQKNLHMIGKEDGFDSTSSSASSEGCGQRVTKYWTEKDKLTLCFRVKTMPPERSKEDHTDNIQRSNSCASQYPIYPHPKLPDCDVIAARFVALKKEHMQTKHGNKQLSIL